MEVVDVCMLFYHHSTPVSRIWLGNSSLNLKQFIHMYIMKDDQRFMRGEEKQNDGAKKE